ncbi:alpha/beta hydrolase [Rhodococcus sp. D2-41]|uniref:alpha/beta hydrolase n=1 Tax=Speluncibacter jeojiensis TaxID=2710754 RepID=UPI00240F0663|nr:alpha/beta hydrolase [Rhodococcus sp. D2-41]MDG3010481.1 alpha/beta hydrolase [Rhodococcus sp. D2-41]
MSLFQLAEVRELLRDSPLDFGAPVEQVRAVFHEMIGTHPLARDVHFADLSLGGVPAIEVHVDTSAETAAAQSGTSSLLYFHGGAYAAGSARDSVGLVADIVRRCGASAYTVDYRLAPEHPYPAATDDAIAAYRGLLESGVPASSIAVVGESAGAGLAMAMLLRIKQSGLPMPAATVVLSPWCDLSLSGDSMAGKAAVDPALTADALRTRAESYLAGADPRSPFAGPLHADLRGLPPLLIQSGSFEILLDDAVRLAARAAADDVAVSLEVCPGAPHVFQGFAEILDEAGEALDRVATFLRNHLMAAEKARTGPKVSPRRCRTTMSGPVTSAMGR